MNNKEASITNLLEAAEDYGKTTIELLKLNTIDKSANIASAFVVQFIIFMVAIMAVVAANIGLALWIGFLLGRVYYGFFIVAGFYFLLVLLIFILRKYIKEPVRNNIIKFMLQKNKE
jgi:hypothetical protein